MSDKILLVENSRSLAALLKKRIEKELNYTVIWAVSYAEALKLVQDESQKFFIGILDLNLPDAPHAEIIDIVISRKIPSIVLTTDVSDEFCEKIWSKKIIDYVVKELPYNIDCIISLIRRIEKNKGIKVLVVDDSENTRLQINNMLTGHNYNVLEAADGKEALRILKDNKDIKMVLTDLDMPIINGLELTTKIRQEFNKDEVAIIGFSSCGKKLIPAKFIKNGANDFIPSPFLAEEFYCRISHSVEMLELTESVRDAAKKDYLTGLYNRSFFFTVGEKFHANVKRGNIVTIIAIFDIDHFKDINDTYGHKAGDIVLNNVATILRNRLRKSDIVCRFGGDEFSVLATNMDPNHALRIFEDVRIALAEADHKVLEEVIKATVSIGVCAKHMRSLDEMVKEADKMLYEAKREGFNMVKMVREDSSWPQLAPKAAVSPL